MCYTPIQHKLLIELALAHDRSAQLLAHDKFVQARDTPELVRDKFEQAHGTTEPDRAGPKTSSNFHLGIWLAADLQCLAPRMKAQ